MAAPDISGKIALVTGASRSIGRAVARRLASAGATVVVCARSFDRPAEDSRYGATNKLKGTLVETVALIEADGGKAIALESF